MDNYDAQFRQALAFAREMLRDTQGVPDSVAQDIAQQAVYKVGETLPFLELGLARYRLRRYVRRLIARLRKRLESRDKAELIYALALQSRTNAHEPGQSEVLRVPGRQGSCSHLLRRIEEADLDPRIRRILTQLVKGQSFTRIAEREGLARSTVERICEKYLPRI